MGDSGVEPSRTSGRECEREDKLRGLVSKQQGDWTDPISTRQRSKKRQCKHSPVSHQNV